MLEQKKYVIVRVFFQIATQDCRLFKHCFEPRANPSNPVAQFVPATALILAAICSTSAQPDTTKTAKAWPLRGIDTPA
jgi:hypothetical protein